MKKTNDIEVQRRKKEKRDIALYNLNSRDLTNLSISYTAQDEKNGFGKKDNVAAQEFLYAPAMNSGVKYRDIDSGEEENLVMAGLQESRENGRPYSGQIREYEIIQKAAAIIQESLMRVKVKDIMELLDSSVKINVGSGERYISDLLESEDPKDKKLGTILVGSYKEYVTGKGVSEALSRNAESAKGTLERIVSGEVPLEQLRLAA